MGKNKNLKKIFILLVAFVGAIVFGYLFQKYILRSRASVNTITATFSPESGDLVVGEEKEINLLLQTDGDSGISGVDLQIDAENLSILEVDKPAPVGETDVSFTELISEVLDGGLSGRIASVLIASDEKLPSVVSLKLLVQPGQQGPCGLTINSDKAQIVGNVQNSTYSIASTASVSYNCVAAQAPGPSVDIFFQPSETKTDIGSEFTQTLLMQTRESEQGISGFDLALRYGSKTLEVVDISSPYETQPEVTPTATPEPQDPGDSVTPVPPQPESCVADADCPAVSCKTDPNTGSSTCPEVRCISGSCVTNPAGISCTSEADCPQPCDDPNQNICKSNKCVSGKCQYSSASVKSIMASQEKNNFTKLRDEVNESLGVVYLTYVVIDKDEYLPKRPAIDLTFRCKAKGSGTVSFTKSQIVGNIAEPEYNAVRNYFSYTCEGAGQLPSITPEVSGSPTTEPEGNIKVNLKLRFAGIDTKPKDEYNSLMVKCSLGDGGLENYVERSAKFVADENGIWSGTLSYKAPAGSGYKLLCKGPKHLQKKVCDASPSESWPGTYACDKGKITLKDGENNLDFSAITMLVGDLPDRADGGRQNGVVNGYDIAFVRNSLGKTDSDSLTIGDLNLDGSITAIDHALIVATLERRADEY